MKLKIGAFVSGSAESVRRPGQHPVHEKRCEWRGIEAEVQEFELDDPVDFSTLDIVLLGGGSDREQMLVCEKLRGIKKSFRDYVEDGGSDDRSVRRLPAARPLLRYG